MRWSRRWRRWQMWQIVRSAKTAKVADSVKAVCGYHRPVERANLKISKARNYPFPTGTRFDFWRADRHLAIPSRGEVSVLSMVQEWSAYRRATGDRYVIEDKQDQHDGNYSPW